jgi:hypothetical protein
MTDTVKTFLKSLIYLSIAIVPFLAWYVPDSMFFPFITGKNFAFRFLVTVSFLSYFILTLYDKPSRPKRSLIFYCYSLFLIVLFVANISGVDPYNSFFSNFERMEGYFTHFYLFLYFVTVYSIYNLDKDFYKLFGYFAAANFLILVEGLLQLFGVPEFWGATFAQANVGFINVFNLAYPVHMGGGLRIDATLGNAAYYGIFTLFFFFISVLLAVKTKNWRKPSGFGVLFGLFLAGFAVLSRNILLAYAEFIATENRGLAETLTSVGAFVWFIGIIFVIYFVYSFVRKMSQGEVSSYVFVFLAFLNALSLYYTQTRGSYIGFAAGVLLIAYILISKKILLKIKSNVLKYILAIAGLFILLFGFYFVSACSFKYLRENTEINNFFVKRLATINLPCAPSEISNYYLESKRLLATGTYPELVSHFGEATIVSRFLNAKISIDAIKEHPWLGYGEENYTNVFAKNYDPRMYAQEEWFDRSHNVFFDWLVAGGVLGLIAYLTLYLSPLYMMWVSDRRKNIDFKERAIITGALVAYFIHNLFVFDNLISYILFITIIAYVASKTFSDKFIIPTTHLKYKENIRLGILVVVIILFALLFRKTVLSPLSVNLNIISAIKVSPTSLDDLASSVDKSYKFSSNSISGNTFGRKESINQSLVKVATYITSVNPSIVPEGYRQAYTEALIKYKNYVEQSFMDSSKERFAIKDVVFFASYLNQIGNFEVSTGYFKIAHEYAPKKQTISTKYVQSLIDNKKYAEALDIAEQSYSLEKTNNAAHETYLKALYFVDKKKYSQEIVEYQKINKEAADTLDKALKSVKI